MAGFAGAAARIMAFASDVGIDVVDAECERLEQRLDRLPGKHAELVVVVQPQALDALVAHLAGIELLLEIAVHGAGIEVDGRGHQHARIGQRFNESRPHVGTGVSPSPFLIATHPRLGWWSVMGVLLRRQVPKLRPFYVFEEGAGIVDVT